jgi:hypothetical protein
MTKDEALRLALEALQNPWKAGPDGVADAIIAIKAALEAKDEPDNSDELTIAYMSGLHRGKEVAQRTLVGLTDEEIDKAWRSVDYTVPWDQHRIDIARAIEAKLKEKNT